jgi:hypothetical protein
MDDFEELLKGAMQRQPAPPGFEQRVLRKVRRPQLFQWRSIAAAAAILTLAVGTGWQVEQHRRERIAGEAAKAKLELALRVTGEKLHKIQSTIDSASQGF